MDELIVININLENLKFLGVHIEQHELLLAVCDDEPLGLIKDDLVDETQVHSLSRPALVLVCVMHDRSVDASSAFASLYSSVRF